MKPNIRIADMAPTHYGFKSKTVQFIPYAKIKKRGFEEIQESMIYHNSRGYDYEMQILPCGTCPTCRMEQSKEWAMRCMMEASEWKYNYFITLTYDDEHKPFTESMTDNKGEEYYMDESWNGYLDKKDLSAFIKRLREYYSRNYNHDNIRFFGCGEYGSKSSRPHYHVIFFNLPIPIEELELIKITKNGQMLYTSREIERLWGKGLISIGSVTLESAAYVARYSLKKRTGARSDEYYARRGQTPEFTNMSRRPGIARNYYELKKLEMYKDDEVIIGKLVHKPPKYFDKLFEEDYPELLDAIKSKRKETAERAAASKAAQTTKTMKEQLWLEGEAKLAKIQQMKRDLE